MSSDLVGGLIVPGLDVLRAEVRDFLAAQSFRPRCDSWVRGYDPAFSRALGERGWIGLSWPVEHGGGGASNVARWVLAEELLRAGAPVAAHWTADRQTGPSLLRFGTTEQCAELLPAIRRGEVVVGLGISESEAGSDLAALRTRAVPVEGGWQLSGSKIWTTSAHHATHIYVLARSDPSGGRHDGLTEFLIDAGAPGLEIRPILDLAGEHHFNEMHFDGVFAADACVLGEVGSGWRQITEQLAFERGGPDRYLSTYPLVGTMLRRLRDAPDRAATERVGALAARMVSIRRLGLELAHDLDAGEAPTRAGGRLKLLGTLFEQDVVVVARYLLDVCPAVGGGAAADAAFLRDAIQVAPASTIRGGATEILRTVLGRGETPWRGYSPDLRQVLDDVLGSGRDVRWQTVVGLDWPMVGVAESQGGAGGDLRDVAELAAAVGRHATGFPLWETAHASWVLTEAGLEPPAPGERAVVAVAGSGGIPWLEPDTVVALVLLDDAGARVLRVAAGVGARSVEASTLADEPVGTLDLHGLDLAAAVPLPPGALARGAVLRAAALHGAIEAACALTREHVTTREQFGKPLVAHQAVSHSLTTMTLERDLLRAGIDVALDRGDETTAFAARAVAGAAAGLVAAAAHQLHGAMGTTREYPLHEHTRRLWAWRDADRSQREWELEVGRRVLRGHSDDVLWELITGG